MCIVHFTMRHAIFELSLLALDKGTIFLLILTDERLVVFESALEKVSVCKEEAPLGKIVFEHETVEKGTVYVTLFGLASLFVVNFLPFEAIFGVVDTLFRASDLLYLVRRVLWDV